MNSGNKSKDEKLEQIKSKVNIENIESDYFLIKVLFDIMKKNKSLEITRYNKKL